jgi:hypothetical protein
MVKQPSDRDGLLACLGEFRPILRYRGIEIELPTRYQDVSAEGDGSLGAGPDQDQRIALPGPIRTPIGETAPQVDDGLAIDKNADGGADFATLAEIALELIAHFRELR